MARIEEYRFGRVVVDGREETRDVIVLPERVVRNWWRAEGHALVLADLADILDELPETLELVADPAQQLLAGDDVLLGLDAQRRATVDDAEDAAPLLGLGDQDVDRVRGRAVDPQTSGA